MSRQQTIAILGAGSHIAKGLICNLLRQGTDALCLFARTPGATEEFLASEGFAGEKRCLLKAGYENFHAGDYDVLINCVGVGSPAKLRGNYTDWFTVTERFDNLCLDYLQRKPGALYLNFSSGAVYGRALTGPAGDGTVNSLRVNHIGREDFYAIARLNSEAKHRAYADLNIVDLRIFSYFSRFIDLKAGYLITDILDCVLTGRVLKTSPVDIVRDYVHPDDLYGLIKRCREAGRINLALDVASAKPVAKSEILGYFSGQCRLKYEEDAAGVPASPNGAMNVYCSAYGKAVELGYVPGISSMETIQRESSFILQQNTDGKLAPKQG